MKIYKFLSFALFILSQVFFLGCKQNHFKVDVSELAEPKVEVHDYASALFTLNRDSLSSELKFLQKEFEPFLGNDELLDEEIIQLDFYINDNFLNDLFKSYQIKFPSLNPLEKDLSSAFRHLKFYFPDEQLPQVFVYISGVQDPVIFQDNILVIGVDNYLGFDYELYPRLGIPKYRLSAMNPGNLLRDVVSEMSTTQMPLPPTNATLLDFMLYEAKKLYFTKSMVPEMEESILLNYSADQLKWLKNKEKDLWKFYIENELLFKLDYNSLKSYINDAPFTSELGNDSPSRTGVWLGYQILLSYAKNTRSDLKSLLENTNSQDILDKSKYKPAR
jgi:hypothetical protein